MPTPAQSQGFQALAEQQRASAQTGLGVMGGQPQSQSQPQNEGLGTPPPPPFQYQPNPSTTLMNQHVATQLQLEAEKKAQAALAAKAEAEKAATTGYAGHGGTPADVQNSGSNAQAQGGSSSQHPNEGWKPSSTEAHQLNVELANRIKSGNIDTQTAMAAIQHGDVSPEIRQALSLIIQHQQGSGANGTGGEYGNAYGSPQGITAQDVQSSGLGTPPQQ